MRPGITSSAGKLGRALRPVASRCRDRAAGSVSGHRGCVRRPSRLPRADIVHPVRGGPKRVARLVDDGPVILPQMEQDRAAVCPFNMQVRDAETIWRTLGRGSRSVKEASRLAAGGSKLGSTYRFSDAPLRELARRARALRESRLVRRPALSRPQGDARAGRDRRRKRVQNRDG